MGLFARRRKQISVEPPNVQPDWRESLVWTTWDAPRSWVAGEARHEENLRELTGPLRREGYIVPVNVQLTRQPFLDTGAVGLTVLADDFRVGYIEADVGAAICPVMDLQQVTELWVCGLIRGGLHGSPNLGVHLWMERNPQPSVQIALTAGGEGQVSWPPGEAELRALVVNL